MQALKHFHCYLYGQEVLLRTDNSAVSWMRNLKAPTGQVARWLQELGTYNLVVTHRPGKNHSNADALSRKPCNVCLRQQELNEAHNNAVEEEPHNRVNDYVVRATTRQDLSRQSEGLVQNQVILDGWSVADVIKDQMSDPDIGPILVEKSTSNVRPSWSKISGSKAALKTLWRQWDRLEVKSGMLYRKFISELGNQVIFQLVVPVKNRKQVMHYYHDIPSAAHLGNERFLGKLRQSFYWPNMSDDIKRYCKNCDICLKICQEKVTKLHSVNIL